jgi:hypothetical protein
MCPLPLLMTTRENSSGYLGVAEQPEDSGHFSAEKASILSDQPQNHGGVLDSRSHIDRRVQTRAKGIGREQGNLL